MRGLALDAYLVTLRAALPLALRVASMPRLFGAITWPQTGISAARARRSIQRAQRVARRLHLADTCLYRATARYVALRAAGEAAYFVMGVYRDEPELGHAWVELAGTAVDETLDARLIPTFRYPRGGHAAP